MKLYNCPDCTHTEDTCENCTRYNEQFPTIECEEINKPYKISLAPLDSNNPLLICKDCPNHPSNGGNEICHCGLGIRWEC